MNRRQMLQTSAASLLLGRAGWAEVRSESKTKLSLPVLEQPDLMFAYMGDAEAQRYALLRSGTAWGSAQRDAVVRVEFVRKGDAATVTLEAEATPVQRIHLRWKRKLDAGLLALGDAWERSYGDLEWRHLQAERAMPWYALVHDGVQTAGMGVKAGAKAFAFWQVDADGVSLWLDVRNGGNGVRLGNRMLEAATLVTCAGSAGESAFAVARRLCRAMVEGIKVPAERGGLSLDVIYGSNDWYYAYGKNTADGILRDADLVKEVAPAGGPRPFTVIDDGYQDAARFPSLPKLAEGIRSRGVVPGIWIRPLRAAEGTPANVLLPDARFGGRGEQPPRAYDPTIAEGMAAALAVATEACEWGYDLIKHDFTTFELLGQWGSQMGASPTRGNWHFNDATRTNAEIVRSLYEGLRKACGEDRIILGCNTMGHLSVGLFDASRTGDDTSGEAWERTRRMGVNTLAFRLQQHGAFHSVDADCVALTPEVAWTMSKQWLRVVAESGTVLLISPDPRSVGAEQKQALREAFAVCAAKANSEPKDWLVSRVPAEWRTAKGDSRYDWVQDEGESPFPIGIQRGPD